MRMSLEEAEILRSKLVEKGVARVFLAPFERLADREAAARRISEQLRYGGVALVLEPKRHHRANALAIASNSKQARRTAAVLASEKASEKACKTKRWRENRKQNGKLRGRYAPFCPMKDDHEKPETKPAGNRPPPRPPNSGVAGVAPAGAPLQIVGGSFDQYSSSDLAFMMAGICAVKDALIRAEPVKAG